MTASNLPLYVSGIVCKGFGRGSKELGIPTANFEQSIVDKFSSQIETGVYFGWAQVDQDIIRKMVMSVGWNPFYKNIQKSMETHIIHQFPSDFYGKELRICIVGFIRPELDFKGIDDLIKNIRDDIAKADEALESDNHQLLKNNTFWLNEPTSPGNGCS